MQRLRFIMIGGFLGAGKTTTLARLARHYIDRGQHVGLVTNDQAQDLVDTNSLRAQGFAVEEVAGACFCCRFDDLVGKVGQLQSRRTARRDPGRAGRQLHRPRRHRRAAAQRPLRRPLRGRALRRAVQAEPRAAHPPQRDRVRLLAQGRLHLPQAARRGRRHRHQPHRRDDAGRSARSWPNWRRRSIPACRCCRCRRRPAKASRR